MKRKNLLRAGITIGILLVLYHLIVFLIPFSKTVVFWLAYGFTLSAVAVAIAAFCIAFVKSPSAKSKFYGFPIARVGGIYLAAQLVVCLVFMTIGTWIPLWPAVLVQAIMLGAAVLGLTVTDAMAEDIQTKDVKLKENVTLIRSLQSKVNPMVAQCDAPDAAEAIKKFAEDLRYADPVSSNTLADIEQDLVAVVDDLQQAVVEGDDLSIKQLCHKAAGILEERNRLCRLNKG